MRRADEGSSPADFAPDLTPLIQQLVLRADERRPPADEREGRASADDQPREVILDVKVDDVRCVLIRVRPRLHARDEQTRLSPREHEIARMVAEGYPNKTIAAVLDISSWTVGTHLRRIFAKLGVGSRAAMVARLLGDRPTSTPGLD